MVPEVVARHDILALPATLGVLLPCSAYARCYHGFLCRGFAIEPDK